MTRSPYRRMTPEEVRAQRAEMERARRTAMKPEDRLIEDLNQECPVSDVTFTWVDGPHVAGVMINEDDAESLLDFFRHYERYPNG